MQADYGLIEHGHIVIENGHICHVGSDLPQAFSCFPREDMEGRLVTPALIDCHTHLVHGGNRAWEFEQRLQGQSYADIARAGGGILSTVAATRGASAETLLASALPRLDALIAEGVAVVEIKSGYGLDVETELKMLRVARQLTALRQVRIKTSFLGAHAVPKAYLDDEEGYLKDICIPALRAAHEERLVDAVDAFCEGIAFSSNGIETLFKASGELALPVKLHAEQLSHTGGAALAARFGALSADHVEYTTEADAKALAQMGTVAVLLPGAFYTLGETQRPPVDAFRRAGTAMALATDCNPGSSPLTSILLAMNMGCTLFGLTPEEALRGVTVHAARALGLKDCGAIAPGLRADLCVWDVAHPAELSYRIAFNPLYRRIFGGEQ
ncbi:MAG: imidazolonepropionase [Pseudomonadota bacterium]